MATNKTLNIIIDNRLRKWTFNEAVSKISEFYNSSTSILRIPLGTYEYAVEILKGREIEAGLEPGKWSDPTETISAWFDSEVENV